MRRAAVFLAVMCALPTGAVAGPRSPAPLGPTASEPVAAPAPVPQPAAGPVASGVTSVPPLPDWAHDVPDKGSLVRVIEVGEGSPRALRLQPPSGLSQSWQMDLDLGMSMQLGGVPMPAANIPAQRIDLRAMVLDPLPDGMVGYSVVVDGVSVDAAPGDPVQQVQSALDTMRGMQVDVVVDATGLVQSSRVTLPPGASKSLIQQAEQIQKQACALAVPLPVEPVGMGARWEVLRRIKTAGVLAAERAEWTLVERDGTRLRLAMAVTQAILVYDAGSGGVPPGASVQIVRFHSEGDAQVTLDLRRLGPSVAATANDVEVEIGVSMGEERVDTVMGMSVRTGLRETTDQF